MPGLCEYIHFSDLARKFVSRKLIVNKKTIKVKSLEYLVKSGVDIEKFDYHAKLPENGVNIRRKKLKLYNCNVM